MAARLLLAAIFLSALFIPVRLQAEEVRIITPSGQHIFRVKVARSREQHERGLMFREHLATDAGMLFDYGYAQEIAMWMKNTKIPLDMLFIGNDGSIVKIARNTVPESLELIFSGVPVRAVLEINGGTSARLGISEGDRVEWPAD